MKKEITLIYATSPHRFGESTAMIDLSIATAKNFGLKDANLIICADGVHPESRYKTKEERAKYAKYLSSLKNKYKDASIFTSESNIGLTLNYKQAWDNNAVDTEFVLFMNHDVAFTPELQNVDIKKVINQFPKKAKTLVFARRDNSFWKRWFDPITYKTDSYWKNALIAFGFQDNSCIMRANAYKEYIEFCYNPKVTKFLEDSVQSQLRKIRHSKTLDKWNKFGVFVWSDACSFHLDGQSKADNGQNSECVWSEGLCASKSLKSIKNLHGKKEVKIAVDDFISEELKFQSSRVYSNFYTFAASLINVSNLHFVSDKPMLQSKVINIHNKLNLPKRTSRFEKLTVGRDFLTINWEQEDNENIVLKVTCNNKQVQYGGNSKGHCSIPITDKINMENDFRIILKEFDSKNRFKQNIIDQSINLSAALIQTDSISINWDNEQWQKLKSSVRGKDAIIHKDPIKTRPSDLGLQCGDGISIQLINDNAKSWLVEFQIPCNNFYDDRSASKIENLIIAADSGLSELLVKDERKSIEHFIRYWKNQ